MKVFAQKRGLTHENWPLRAGVVRKAPGSPMVIIQVCLLWGVLVLMSNLAPNCTCHSQGNDSFCAKTRFHPWKLAPEIRSGKKSSRITHGDNTSMFAMGSFSSNVQLVLVSSATLRIMTVFAQKRELWSLEIGRWEPEWSEKMQDHPWWSYKYVCYGKF